jgi:ABC-type glycerol-3-phosphate transport system permease component
MVKASPCMMTRLGFLHYVSRYRPAYALFFIPFAVWLLLGFFEDCRQEVPADLFALFLVRELSLGGLKG